MNQLCQQYKINKFTSFDMRILKSIRDMIYPIIETLWDIMIDM